MSSLLVKTVVRTLFSLTSRASVTNQIHATLHNYMQLASQIDVTKGAQPVMVPPMRGIDEDMRNWSFFMILEHNMIVNRSITSIVEQLSRQQEPVGTGVVDPKRDVMPSPSSGKEQIEGFRRSIEAHLECIPTLGPLKGTRTKDHPIFGPFDAHKWNCMFAFHLKLHLRQARFVSNAVCRPSFGA